VIRSATGALQVQTHAVLRAASDGAEAQLREFLSSLRGITESLGADAQIRASLEGDSRQALNMTQLLAQVRTRVPEAQEIFWTNPQGRVVAGSRRQLEGKEESGTPYFEQGRRGFYPGEVVRDSQTGELTWIMSAPVKDARSGQLLGVVALAVDPGLLSALTTGNRDLQEGSDTQSFRIGKTGKPIL
jgi:C4-dicarboxylate-specific signal transduction histidine kinase